MDYQKHYNLLINKANNRLLEGYTENHHIIPRCMHGSNDEDNLVALTPEEHYCAHLLLVKIWPKNRKLIYAAHMLTIGLKRKNNKEFGWLRRRKSEFGHSEETKLKISEAGKGRFHSDKTKRKMSEAQKGKVFSEETKKKLSEANKGTKHSDKTKRKISETGKGRIPWNKGKILGPHTEEAKRKIGLAQKGKKRIYREDGSYYMSKNH